MKRYISSTILALVIAGLPTVALAKGPNPLQGYISVWNNLAEKAPIMAAVTLLEF